MEDVTQERFRELVIERRGKVLVDFWAEWCGVACGMMGRVLDELSPQYRDVTFLKVNVDDATDITNRYGIRSCPTLLAFEDGEVRGRVVGALSRDKLVAELDGFLA